MWGRKTAYAQWHFDNAGKTSILIKENSFLILVVSKILLTDCHPNGKTQVKCKGIMYTGVMCTGVSLVIFDCVSNWL